MGPDDVVVADSIFTIWLNGVFAELADKINSGLKGLEDGIGESVVDARCRIKSIFATEFAKSIIRISASRLGADESTKASPS